MKKIAKWLFMYKENTYLFLLFILCLVILLSHTLYVLKTYQYPMWDEHKYLGNAVNYISILHSSNAIPKKIHELYENFLNSQQPLYPLIILLPLLFLGTMYSYKISLWINVLFYIATIISVYFLGKEFLSKKASLLAAYIFAFSGFPLFYLHFTYTETAATAFVTVSLYFLVKTKNFTKTKLLVLFSIFFAFGIFTRWTVPIFILGPFLVCLVAFFRSSVKKKAFFRNFAIFFLIVTIPLLLYYLPTLHNFLDYVQTSYAHSPSWVSSNLKNPFSSHSVIYYFTVLAQQTIFFYLLFLVSILISLTYWRRTIYLLSAILIPYCFFTFLVVFKDDRFIVPLYPTLAIISATIFDYIGTKRKLKIFSITLIVLTLVIGFLNFLGSSWGIGPMKFSTQGNKYTLPNSILMPLPLGHPRRIWLAPISWPPIANEGNADEIISVIKHDWGQQKYLPNVLQTYEFPQITSAMYAITSYEDLGVYNGYSLSNIPKNSYKLFFSRFNDANYVLIKSGNIDDNHPEGKDSLWDKELIFVREFEKTMRFNNEKLPVPFTLIAKIAIPYDRSSLWIYRKQGILTKAEWEEFANLFIAVKPKDKDQILQAISIYNNP